MILDNALLHRLIRFGAVGLFNTLAYFVLANALHYALGVPTAYVSYLAYFALVPVSFLGHKRITFETKGRTLQEFSKFVLIQAVNLVIIALANLTANRMAAPGWASFAIISIAIPSINFVVLQIWVFAERR